MRNDPFTYDLTAPVSTVLSTINWGGRSRAQQIPSRSEVKPYPFGIPPLLMDWTVEQFFGSFQWSGVCSIQDSQAIPIDSIVVEEPFTLTDLSNCF